MAPRDPSERAEHFFRTFRVCLAKKLASGDFTPSPRIQIVEGGLESANKALDQRKGGVSGTKLVIEL